jgi:hypothetical protein
MQTTDAAEYLIKKLREQRDIVKDEVIRMALSQDEYSRLRGVTQGLDFAMQLILDLAKKVEENDG